MAKYEYKTVELKHEYKFGWFMITPEEQLEQLKKDGWLIVSIEDTDFWSNYITVKRYKLKRKI